MVVKNLVVEFVIKEKDVWTFKVHTFIFGGIKMIAMTFVGIRYYNASCDAKIGDKCIIDIIDGTCKLLNENGEAMGVLPASPYKLKEVEAMGFPLVENCDGRVMDIFHQEFVITTIISSSMIVVEEVVEETIENKGENMEEKIKAINKESIVESVMERNVSVMTIELMQDGLSEAYDKAKEEYPMEVLMYSMQYIDLHPVANIVMTLRSIDNLVALKYLNGQVSGGEFDHMRAWIGIHAYFYYEHIIEEVSMEEFFTEASIKASEKFLKEQEKEAKEYRNDNEDGGDDTTSSSSINNSDNDEPIIEFVSWTQQSYAWCGSDVTIRVNGKEITLKHPLTSGGSVWFDEDWDEHVEDGPWGIDEDALPNELKPHIKKVVQVINNSIPWGCCGGCV